MLLPKLKDSLFWKTVTFAVPRVLRTGPGLVSTIIVAEMLAALLAPAAALLIGKLAAEIKLILATPAASTTGLLPWVLAGAAISILTASSRIAQNYSSSCMTDRMTLVMQHRVVEHINSLDLALIEDRDVQDIISRGTQAPGQTMLKFTTGFLSVVTHLIRITGLLGVLFWVSPLWASIILLLGIPALAANRYLSYINFKIKRSKTTARRWSGYYTGALTNRSTIPTISTLGIADLFLSRFDTTMQDVFSEKRKFYRLRSVVMLTITLVMAVTIIAALLSVAGRAPAATLRVGRLTAFWVAAWRIQASISNLGRAFFDISECEFNIFNLRELFTLTNTMPPSGTRRLTQPCGKIEVRDLSFTYRGTERPVLKQLSMTIQQGETVAIVGANGSGKTTLAKLIAQFYAPTSGTILIDDHLAFEYNREAFHERISFLSQNPVQFEATAFENIAFGDWRGLENDSEAVQDIARRVNMDKTIQNMPDGYDTLLGRRFGEYDISGGQRQKLALARALACDPDLIILDEPTAALDIHTEFELYSSIRELTRNKTTILISHRFTTVRMADRIFVLNEGMLTEAGTHTELIAANGTYAAMSATYERMANTPDAG